MFSEQIGDELAIVALVCVLLIFLFPATQGPYSAMHGPVSALQSTRAAANLRISIVYAALKTLNCRPNPARAVLLWVAGRGVQLTPFLVGSKAIRRC